ncbi:nucleolar protein 4 [Lipomyces japonicus]|uniref:nucleolar protein 4 n=1 Tax=Lipomyces japonicus TaxID=56871 RepID=UPI0034CD8F78
MSKEEVKQQEVVKKDDEDSSSKNTTLFVRSLPPNATSESLADFYSQIVPVKHSVVVTDKQTQQSKGFGFVTFALAEDAQKALVESRKTKFEGSLLRVEVAKKRERKPGDELEVRQPKPDVKPKPARTRLIIRNLPWSIRNPDQLTDVFKGYGKITELVIPRKTGGRMSGFAFVNFKKRSSAERAVKEANGFSLDGREIAVDFAIEKDQWTKHVEVGETSSLKSNEESEKETDSQNEDSEDEESEVDDSDQSQDEEEDNEEVNEDDSEHDSDESDEGEDVDNSPSKSSKEHPFKNNFDTTVFIRNLAYSVTSEILVEHFTSSFGPVRYALPVTDRETGLPRGTGFVSFRDKESYTACLASAPSKVQEGSSLIADDTDSRYVLTDRVLLISPAVDRGRAEKLAEISATKRLASEGKDMKDKTDRRNIFLLNEGRILPESELGKLISKADMDVRQRSYTLRRQQLRSNPSLHLSLTRLAIRNIPRSMSATQLKQLGRQAIVRFAEEVKAETRARLTKEELERSRIHDEELDVSEKQKKRGVVKQAKIIFEGSEKSGRSRGYGFIEYSSHRLALMGLRYLNAKEIGPQDLHKLVPITKKGGEVSNQLKSSDIDSGDKRKRRLVVEFAIDNIEVVKRRADRQKGPPSKETFTENNSKDSKKGDENPGTRKRKEDGSGVSQHSKSNNGKRRKFKKN